jgi:hypothetical protein|tara:strand:- start:395 stop:583 length:189 start_codon:yes stop_codon:yes gene_type:complete
MRLANCGFAHCTTIFASIEFTKRSPRQPGLPRFTFRHFSKRQRVRSRENQRKLRQQRQKAKV